ncbi:endolytic transglycosylase MltG [Candidatus Kaiserbacteria bacterium]|nr:endolytic transglycosylase MltG [Candidatus Kaiserbacteria bacterium]
MEALLQSLKTRARFAYLCSKALFFGTRKRKTVFFAALFILYAAYFNFFTAPASFPVGHIVTIEKGMTIEDIGVLLQSEDVIRSSVLFRISTMLLNGERNAHAGDYYFEKQAGVFPIAFRITHGEFGLEQIIVRIPEGFTVKEIAGKLSSSLDTFDGQLFISLAKADEGYLFPDTYHFLPNVSEQEVFRVMKETFNRRMESIASEIEAFGKPRDSVVIMASILEREAHDAETKRKIAGVLWSRIALGMPLQVDASFVYILGKGTAELSLDDLKIDSPYNTYLYAGLPPGPISNPGLDSLRAAVTPIESNYLYYLADKNGVTHFSETFEEHKRKKVEFLN